MGILLVQGRLIGPQDTKSSQKVAVVTESMAQKFFPTGSPIGKRFGIEGRESTERIEVIGVVKDAKYGGARCRLPAGATCRACRSDDRA
jgi:hypothetical protein